MMKAIAIDDEPVALDIIRDHAAKVPFIDLAGVFLSASAAQAYLEREPVQLVFADINMPDLSGLEFAERIRSQALVIFTTAHPEFAIDGFDLAATDYLLKPINFDRFFQACQLAKERLSGWSSPSAGAGNSLFIKDGYNWVKIDYENLLYAKAEDNYIALCETNKTTLTRMTLGRLLERLPAEKFIQVHKSFIVAIPKIERVERHQLTISGKKIPLSTRFRDDLIKKLEK